jgi:3-isopropylmalate/(R)-2-methylmalate dehydratase large subunit
MDRIVDIFVLDDSIDGELLSALERFGSRPTAATIIINIDHGVPSNTVALTRTQNRLRRLASRWDAELFDGRGVGQVLLLGRSGLSNKTIVSAGAFVSGCAALGACGFEVGPEAFLRALQRGMIPLGAFEHVVLELAGERPPRIHPRDMALTLIQELGDDAALKGAMVEVVAQGGGLSCPETAQFMTALRDAEPELVFLSGGELSAALGEPASDYRYIRYDLGNTVPMLAKTCGNRGPVVTDRVSAFTDHPLDQGFIGGCLGGSLHDLYAAADVLAGRRINPWLHLIIAPDSQAVYGAALEEGLIDVFLQSGAIVANPGCSGCAGFHQGVIGPDDVMIATGSSHCPGRRHDRGTLLLASPATVAASCCTGKVEAYTC